MPDSLADLVRRVDLEVGLVDPVGDEDDGPADGLGDEPEAVALAIDAVQTPHEQGRNSVPAGALTYGVHAQQFEWQFSYRGPDGQLGTGDDFTLRNRLHIPVNQPVVMRLTAEDVIHSLFIPAFRIKQDAMPGMSINVWFEATEVGQFEIACAELCGIGHTTMGATVTVHSADDYQRWLADQVAAADQ